ncbi:hypothetical protein [Rufibacter latericius]|nr:hypothetical protein [Rufibacter latericius]
MLKNPVLFFLGESLGVVPENISEKGKSGPFPLAGDNRNAMNPLRFPLMLLDEYLLNDIIAEGSERQIPSPQFHKKAKELSPTPK